MKTLFTLAVLLSASLVVAQNEQKPALSQRVNDFISEFKTPEAIEAKLKEWTAREPQNPDPYILAANAYLAAAEQVLITSKTKQPGFQILDPKTSKQVGTLATGPDVKTQMKGEAILTTAAAKFPQRLDIHVGRMSICERADDTQALVKAAKDMLGHVTQQGEKLRWVDDTPIDLPLEVKVVDEIHGRIRWLYKKEKPDTDKAAYDLATAALKLYPKNVKLLNVAALYHAYNKQWDKAREIFIKAAESDPDDMLVQLNIAMTSARMGETEEARKRWEAVIKKDPQSNEAQQAKEGLKTLKNGGPKKR